MTDERKKELFPYFAYLYSQQLDPEKYGNIDTIEEWTGLIREDEQAIQKISDAAEQLQDDDWDALEEQYNKASENNEGTQYAAKGAKLKSKKKNKKCACGCDLLPFKEKGGKVTLKCACGCKQKKGLGGEISSEVSSAKSGAKIDRISKAQKGKSIVNKKDLGNGETWSDKNIGTGNNSMNPKDWSAKKKKNIEIAGAKADIETGKKNNKFLEAKKKVATAAPNRVGKKKKGGLIQKYEIGGLSGVKKSKADEVLQQEREERTKQWESFKGFLNKVAAAAQPPKGRVQAQKLVTTPTNRISSPYAFGNMIKPHNWKPEEGIINSNNPTILPEVVVSATAPTAPTVAPRISNTKISLVDYLASQGKAFDKASRAAYARMAGMKDYNYSAEDNTKLLSWLKANERVTPMSKPIGLPMATVNPIVKLK